MIAALVVVLALRRRGRRSAALPETDHHHRGRVFFRDPCAVPGRQSSDHGCAGRFDRQDRAGRRQDASHVALQQQVQGARQRHRVDPQPQPGGLAHHPAVTALHRWAGAEGRRGDPDRAHPGARRVGSAARFHQRDPAAARARHAQQPKGPFGERHRIGRGQPGRQGQAGQRHPEQFVGSVDRAERGPRGLRRDHAKPGAVRQRAVPERSTVRRTQRQPGPVHRLVHQIRPRRGRHGHSSSTTCSTPPESS